MISARFGISSICFPLAQRNGNPNTSTHDRRPERRVRTLAGRPCRGWQAKEHRAMAWDFTVSEVIPAAPGEIYEAWLSSDGHKKITGGAPADISPAPGGRLHRMGRLHHRAQPDAGAGTTDRPVVADEPIQRRRIRIRSVEVLLEPCPEGTRVTLHHTNVPDGHTSYRDGGWQDNYFEPMKATSAAQADGRGSRSGHALAKARGPTSTCTAFKSRVSELRRG